MGVHLRTGNGEKQFNLKGRNASFPGTIPSATIADEVVALSTHMCEQLGASTAHGCAIFVATDSQQMHAAMLVPRAHVHVHVQRQVVLAAPGDGYFTGCAGSSQPKDCARKRVRALHRRNKSDIKHRHTRSRVAMGSKKRQLQEAELLARPARGQAMQDPCVESVVTALVDQLVLAEMDAFLSPTYSSFCMLPQIAILKRSGLVCASVAHRWGAAEEVPCLRHLYSTDNISNVTGEWSTVVARSSP